MASTKMGQGQPYFNLGSILIFATGEARWWIW